MPTRSATPEAPAAAPTPEAPADPGRHEVDVLLPEPGQLKLVSGIIVKIVPLKLRELLKLIRIVTRGGAQLLPNLRFSGVAPADFAAQFAALVLFALPEAENEAVEFIQAMVEPEELRRPVRTDADRAFNTQQWELIYAELTNPELDDVVTIIESVVQREAEDLQSLGKRLMSAFKMAEKVGVAPAGTGDSSAGSAARPT